MNEYDAIGCIHGVYMYPGYKSKAPRQSIATDISAGSKKTIINYRYQKYICNYTNKPSFHLKKACAAIISPSAQIPQGL